MKEKKPLLITLFLAWVASSFAAKVDTLLIKSPSTSKDVQVVAATPDAVLGKEAAVCPAIYSLHGYGGSAKTWIGIGPNLPQITDEKGIIFVCPDRKSSWYWGSPLNPSYRYETFIPSELMEYIDEHYETVANRKGRVITGLSMGGHRAMWNAVRHKDAFSVSGNASGGMDIRPFPKNWDMPKQLGEHESNKEVWDNHTAINQIDKIENGDLTVIVDRGEEDFFLSMNKDLHNRLLEKKIDYDSVTRPGGHTGQYWNNSIDYQILFFGKFLGR